MIAFAFLLALILNLVAKIPLLLPKVFGFKVNGGAIVGSRRNGGSSARNKGSDVSSFHMRPEEVLGNLLSKYNTLTKEMQIATCIKHIELWKQLMVDAEIPAREETTEGQSQSKKVAGAAYLASARIPFGSHSGLGRGGASKNLSNASALNAQGNADE